MFSIGVTVKLKKANTADISQLLSFLLIISASQFSFAAINHTFAGYSKYPSIICS